MVLDRFQEPIGLQLRHVGHIFNMNLVNFTFHSNEFHSMTSITLLSPKYTFHVAITSYVLNVALCEVMQLVAPESIIHLYMLLDYVP